MSSRGPVLPSINPVDAARLLDGSAAEGAGSPAEAATLAPLPSGERALLVDVREPGEFLDVRAPGAVLYPLSSFVGRFRELPNDRPLLVICAHGNRSQGATAFLLREGYPDVRNVTGGMAEWVRAGLPYRRGPLSTGEGLLPPVEPPGPAG